MSISTGQPGSVTGGSFRWWVIVFGVLLVLIVNREFGVADNGDFTRYMANYASKPVELEHNWPPRASAEFDYRFFTQPLFYWSPPAEGFPDPWFSSANWFWWMGKKTSDVFYSQEVVNLKFIGLPFFLLHALALGYMVRFFSLRNSIGVLAFAGVFLLYTDARITAFYNSFFAESVPLLAVFLSAAYFFERIHSRVSFSGLGPPGVEQPGWEQPGVEQPGWEQPGVEQPGWEQPGVEQPGVEQPGVATSPGKMIAGLFPFLLVALLICAILAKRQYAYFILPTLLVVFYLIHSRLPLARRAKNVVFAAICAALFGAIALATINQRVDHAAENSASRYTSYHALYYGLLPHSADPTRLLAELGLPAASLDKIGEHIWSEENLAFVEREKNINLATFLRAIYLEPLAFMHSLAHNAGEVGNFDIPLGTVYGANLSGPPLAASAATRGIGKFAGTGLFLATCILALVLFVVPVGVPPDRRFASRIFSALLLSVLVCDVLVSTFDGQQEARKHVLVASLVSGLILLHGCACLSGLRPRQWWAGADH